MSHEIFTYKDLCSERLAEVLRREGYVDVRLTKHRARLTLFMTKLIDKISQGKPDVLDSLRKRDYYLAMVVNFYMALFHMRLAEIEAFVVLEKPIYSILEADDIIRFEVARRSD